jgi:hypothetical protein
VGFANSAYAQYQAIELEKALIAALETQNSAIIGYARDRILPIYIQTALDSSGLKKVNQDIVQKIQEFPRQFVDFGGNYGV